MGLFRVRGRLTGPTGCSEDAKLLVDTGATLLVVPGPGGTGAPARARWARMACT